MNGYEWAGVGGGIGQALQTIGNTGMNFLQHKQTMDMKKEQHKEGMDLRKQQLQFQQRYMASMFGWKNPDYGSGGSGADTSPSPAMQDYGDPFERIPQGADALTLGGR